MEANLDSCSKRMHRESYSYRLTKLNQSLTLHNHGLDYNSNHNSTKHTNYIEEHPIFINRACHDVEVLASLVTVSFPWPVSSCGILLLMTIPQIYPVKSLKVNTFNILNFTSPLPNSLKQASYY